MALVNYSSSDEDEDDTQPTNHSTTATLKRKREEALDLPPLPSKFHDLYASTTRVSTRDDPALHGGRKRVGPHVEGNWPTHLYIEWYPSTAENGSLTDLISKLSESASTDKADICSFLTSDLGAPLPLHISLSRPIGLSTVKKDTFIISLEDFVKSSGIRPFNVTIASLDWVPNFEKTRWFLVLRLQQPPLNGLNKLLHISNKAVQQYEQPTLYATPREVVRRSAKTKSKGSQDARWGSESKIDWSDMQEVSDAFHVSIAWKLERPSVELLATTKSMVIDRFEGIKKISFKVEEMKAKVGNSVTNFPLPRNFIEEKALWGV